MISAGSCYVVETHFIDDGSVEFELFEDSNDADFFAASQIINHMTNDFACNTSNVPQEYKDAYQSILSIYQAGNYNLVVDEFNDFNQKVVKVQEPDNMISIILYDKNIVQSAAKGSTVPVNSTINSSNMFFPMKNFVNGTSTTSSVVPTVAVSLVDVPCRVCKRNVNKSEKNCWHCGCDNPANS